MDNFLIKLCKKDYFCGTFHIGRNVCFKNEIKMKLKINKTGFPIQVNDIKDAWQRLFAVSEFDCGVGLLVPDEPRKFRTLIHGEFNFRFSSSIP